MQCVYLFLQKTKDKLKRLLGENGVTALGWGVMGLTILCVVLPSETMLMFHILKKYLSKNKQISAISKIQSVGNSTDQRAQDSQQTNCKKKG